MSLGNLPRVIGKKPSWVDLNSLRWLFASWPIVGLPNVHSYIKFSKICWETANIVYDWAAIRLQQLIWSSQLSHWPFFVASCSGSHAKHISCRKLLAKHNIAKLTFTQDGTTFRMKLHLTMHALGNQNGKKLEILDKSFWKKTWGDERLTQILYNRFHCIHILCYSDYTLYWDCNQNCQCIRCKRS